MSASLRIANLLNLVTNLKVRLSALPRIRTRASDPAVGVLAARLRISTISELAVKVKFSGLKLEIGTANR